MGLWEGKASREPGLLRLFFPPKKTPKEALEKGKKAGIGVGDDGMQGIGELGASPGKIQGKSLFSMAWG